jgi:hypothetical protein
LKSRDEFEFKPQVQPLLETRLEISDFVLFLSRNFFNDSLNFVIIIIIYNLMILWENRQETDIELLLSVNVPV